MPEVWLKEQLPDGHPDHGRCTAQKVAEAGETFKRKNKDALPKRRRAAAGIAVGGKTRTAKGGNLRATPEAIQEAQRVHAALLVKEAAKAEKLKMLESQVELLWEAPPLLGGAACQTLFALGEDDCSPPEDAASSAFEVLLRVLSLCAGWTHASAALKAIERSAASVLQIIHHRHIACSWCRSYFRSISSAADYQGSRLGLDDGSDSASEYSEDGEVRPISAAIPPTAPVRKPRRAQLSRGDLVHQLLRSRSRMLNSMASWLRYLQKLLPEERLAAALVLDEGVERGRSTLIIGDIPGAAPVGASGTAPTPKVSLVRHEVLESDLKAALGIAMGRSGSSSAKRPRSALARFLCILGSLSSALRLAQAALAEVAREMRAVREANAAALAAPKLVSALPGECRVGTSRHSRITAATSTRRGARRWIWSLAHLRIVLSSVCQRTGARVDQT
jgi:hypothetical protein